MKNRAFSLIELVLVCLLLSGMLIFTITNFGSQKKRASSQSLVQVVAAELQSARSLAIRSNAPVAVCFPTARGTLAHCQSLYLMEGLARPRITRVVDYSREFEQSVLALGCWGSCNITRPSSGENFSSVAPQRWLGNGFLDYALIFTPDGAVTSNDLPLLDGSYHILAAGQVAYSPTGAPPGTASMTTPPAYFTIDKVHAAHTLTISPTGSVSFQTGVVGGGVTIVPQAFAMGPPAPRPVVPTQAAVAPVISQIDVQPRATLKPKMTVQQGRNLTLKVDASDANGDPLFCSWTSEGVGGGPPGVFSTPANSPMQWDPQRQLWSLTTTWSPPPTSVVGDGYKLECKVSDPSNRFATRLSPVLDPVTVIPPSRLVYSFKNPSNSDIAIINADGSGFKRLTTLAGDNVYPCLSPDGTKIVFTSSRTGQSEIFTMNVDGTDQKRLTTNTASDWSPHWSVDGSQIFFGRNWPDAIWVMNADGSGTTRLTVGFGANYDLQQSPNGKYVSYVGVVGAAGVPSVSSDVIVGEYVNDGVNPPKIIDSTNLTNNAALRIGDSLQCWLPDNSMRILYNSVDPQGLPLPSYTMLRTLNIAKVVDHGPGAVPRFSLTDQATLFGTNSMYADYRDVRITPDMQNIVTPIGFGQIYIADINLAATPPSVTNLRPLTNVAAFPGNWSRR